MRAGRLFHSVTFQSRASGENSFGESNGSWADVITVRAGVEPIAGREFFASQQVQSDINTRIICRYSTALAAITQKHRIKHGTDYYDIRAIIDPNKRRKELQFMCTLHSIS